MFMRLKIERNFVICITIISFIIKKRNTITINYFDEIAHSEFILGTGQFLKTMR